jgi:CheY-like chemotaxis protein
MSQGHALIIDDNQNNVAVLVHLLRQHRVTSTQVITLDQLPRALDTLTQIDVVFLDLEMPERSGYDVLQELQAEDRFVRVPIVAYTVHASEIHTALQVGFHSFLPKPLDSDRFGGQLARILRGERVWERG